MVLFYNEVEQRITVFGPSFENIYFIKMSEEIFFQNAYIQNVK